MAINGQLRPDELVEVESGIYLATSTAAAWKRLVAAAQKEANLSVWVAKPHGGYRDLAAQQALYSGVSAGNPLSSVTISRPGYSTHGFGTRVDVGSFYGMRETWVTLNAHRFGFTREFGAIDPNHFRHDGTTAAGVDAVPIVVPRYEGSTMYLMRVLAGTIYLVTPNGAAPINDPAHVALFQRLFKSFPDFDTFNDVERGTILGYIRAASTDDAEILAALKSITTTTNTQQIIAGVIAGMPRGATPEEVAKAVIAEIAS